MDGVPINYTLDLNPSTSFRAGSGLTQVLSDGTNTYTYGLGRISQTNTSTEYFLNDALGSVRQLTASNGDVTLAKSYDPYGVVTPAVLKSSSIAEVKFVFADSFDAVKSSPFPSHGWVLVHVGHACRG
ncbi:MAG: hypothetical protein MUO77_14880 [Anaerolineales bacterium]|nr:hypothetical protein [Anaerolineales bacterium]